eukprot:SAG22_NODE_3335_length_1772_cov_6.983264_2_plen_257_part_00
MDQLDDDDVNFLYDAFSKFDKDGSGSVTSDELAAVLEELGQDAGDARVQEMLEEIDTDHDGTIDFMEFMEKFATLKISGPAELWQTKKGSWAPHWLSFNGITLKVYQCETAPGPGDKECFQIKIESATPKVDPKSATIFYIDDGAAIPQFKVKNGATRQTWLDKFASAKKSGLSSLELLMRDKDYGLAIGKYKLAELLNEGGFAKVKSGIDTETGKRVACKIMALDVALDIKNEIVLQGALKSQYICQLLDIKIGA